MHFNPTPAFLLFILIYTHSFLFSQVYPSYGDEKQVAINGLSFDAMEPFISPDGSILFFNNENDGVTTKLYYAQRVNDSVFNFVGELNGPNQTVTPYLDAVADLDVLGNFYWTSTRKYPIERDNLFHGIYNSGSVNNIGRLHGDFYNYGLGWLLMDHGISHDGQFLYFNNARFDGSNCAGPCETHIGVAQKLNDSTFATLSNSNGIMKNVNDSSFKFYAPCITKDGLELYYTRFPQGVLTGKTVSDICVVVRETATDTFSLPKVLFSDLLGSSIVEAVTLTTDKQIMYFHKKVNGVFKIMMRNRISPTGIFKPNISRTLMSIFPNPMQKQAIIEFENPEFKSFTISIIDAMGVVVHTFNNVSTNQVHLQNDLEPGLYVVQIWSKNTLYSTAKLMVN